MTAFIYQDTAPLVSRALDQRYPDLSFADWDGRIEISQCVETFHGVERIDDDADDQHWNGSPFWSVYLHQSAGGVACVADLRTEEEAEAFAAGLVVYRNHLLTVKD